MATYTTGEALMCCVAKEAAGNLNRDTIEEIWNGQHYREARLAMLAGEKVSACMRCYAEEDVGIDSHRTIENHIWEHGAKAKTQPMIGTEFLDRLIDQTDDTGYAHNPPITFDFRLGNTCNLQCVMCGPKDSSKWVNFAQQLGQDMSRWDTSKYNWVENDDFWNKQFLPLLPNIKHLVLAGGEPLLLKQHTQLLERCIAEGHSKNIVIRYHTNGTTIPDYLFGLWEKFKYIDLMLSIDCWGEKNDYIRYPGKWDDVIDNMHMLDDSPDNIVPRILATVNAYNVFYMTDYADWLLDQKFRKMCRYGSSGTGLYNVGFVHGPTYLNIKVLPKKVKEQITIKYDRWHANHNNKEFYSNRIYEIKNFMNDEDLSRHFAQFLNYTKKIDNIRNTSFEQTFPEYWTMLKEYF
jgi:MoaA/NifB/PqqE/SkfB family radical SAM enzyme